MRHVAAFRVVVGFLQMKGVPLGVFGEEGVQGRDASLCVWGGGCGVGGVSWVACDCCIYMCFLERVGRVVPALVGTK